MEKKEIENPPTEIKQGDPNVATIIIHSNMKTGQVQVTGHLQDKFMALQMLISAGSAIMRHTPPVLPTNGKQN